MQTVISFAIGTVIAVGLAMGLMSLVMKLYAPPSTSRETGDEGLVAHMNMSRARAFRLLVIASTVCYVIWCAIPYGVVYFLPVTSEYRMAVELGAHRALLPVGHPLYFGAWFVSWLVAAAGLLFFQNWARHTYLALSVLGLVTDPLSGFMMQTPIDRVFNTTNSLLDGAILTLAYFSPTALFFRKTSPSARDE